MGHRFDIIEKIRLAVVPKIGILFRAINDQCGTSLYATNPTSESEYAGTVECSEDKLELILAELGFERNPIAALKYISDSGEWEEGSWRWLPPEDSDLDSRKQLHVRLYDGSVENDANTGKIHLYAHWEYRWDTNPIKHYRGEEWDASKGVELMQRKLHTGGINYEV